MCCHEVQIPCQIKARHDDLCNACIQRYQRDVHAKHMRQGRNDQLKVRAAVFNQRVSATEIKGIESIS